MTKQTKLGGNFTLPDTSMSLYRMSYGAMQLAGPGVWGPPRDVDAAGDAAGAAVGTGAFAPERVRGQRVDQAGRPVFRRSEAGVDLVTNQIMDQRRSQFILDQLASSDFQTDWGTRGVAASSTRFNPASYASGIQK